MSTYETTATVEDHGQLHVAGVPFERGTEVQVTIRVKADRDAGPPPVDLPQARVRMSELFARVRARNTESVGLLHREELYDRKVLRGHEDLNAGQDYDGVIVVNPFTADPTP